MQVATGFGFSLLCAPFLITVYGAHRGVQINLVLSCALNIAILVRERRGIDRVAVLWMLLPAGVVVVAVAAVVRQADTDTLTTAAGVLIVAGVVAMARGTRAVRAAGRAGAVRAGAISGGMTVLSGAGGPPVVLYAVNADWLPERTRPTLQAFFLGLNAVALASLGPPKSIPVALPVAVLVGLAAGWVVAPRLDADHVRRGTLVLAAAGGCAAIARGLLG